MSQARRLFSVLLAEDDDAHRASLGQVLSADGLSVIQAVSGTEAIKLMRKVEVDFSILDLHMPGLSGIETIRLLRQEGRPLPCILISGGATKEEQIQAMVAGAFTFLSKPVEPGMLRHTVERLIDRHFPSA